jgi:hypothetical protein
MKTATSKKLENYLSKSNYTDKTFTEEFNKIISEEIEGYNGTIKEQLKSFFNDLQHGGCQSGMISEFIYNSDCKDFYIKHIDDLEEMKEELEDNLGEPIQNRNSLPHYTFLCWLCFEEYCYDLYNQIFED